MSPRCTSKPSRLASWLLVLVCVFSLPGFSPLVVATLATLMSDHAIEIALDHGHLDVVVHHHSDESHANDLALEEDVIGIRSHTDDHGHHHDHVLHFENNSVLRHSNDRVGQLIFIAAAWSLWHSVSLLPLHRVSEIRQNQALRSPPPIPLGILCLRTTVLLV